jgi:hypothetical protein
VEIDPRYYRPAEVELLIGDASKAKRKMGWEPKTKFKDLAFFASPRGGVGPSHLHKRGHSILFAGRLASLRGRGWAGRRLCRPPAREGGWMRAPVGALGGEGRWDAFSESAEGGRGPRGLDPYREVGSLES